MVAYTYTIKLTSDAEPGTGLGSSIIDDLAPRDPWRKPVLRASHVKGLMRQSLKDVAEPLAWDDALEARVFGLPDETKLGHESSFRLTDAVATTNPPISLVSRTALHLDTGTAADQTLRTTESIPVGTVFTGTLYTSVDPDSVEDLAWRLALLAVPAVGAGRTRGSGACVVTIEDENRSLGRLLKTLARERQTWTGASAVTPASGVEAPPSLSETSVVLRLIFEAHTPVCCPEVADKTNVISSGFRIPASAVQGVILNRLSAIDSDFATRVFNSQYFRLWPLLPSWAPTSEAEPRPDPLPVSIRVGLTHRVAKFSGEFDLQPEQVADPSIEWRPESDLDAGNSASSGAAPDKPVMGPPLKAVDGVLIRDAKRVRLWKAGDMPRVITGHGVHNRRLTVAEREAQAAQTPTSEIETEGGRNLFTIDAMAPMVWQGLVVLPPEAGDVLVKSLEQDPIVAFGKSRSVRGIGHLKAIPLNGLPSEWMTPDNATHTVLVAQSPLHLPKPIGDQSELETEFKALVRDWATEHGLISESDVKKIKVWAALGVHFGWSRYGDDANKSGRQPARRVIQPGSVIAFPTRLDNERLAEALKAGIGDERERGFGAVSVHPGKATGLYKPTPEAAPPLGSHNRKESTQLILQMHKKADRLPSPSQLRAVQQRLAQDKDAALAYLERQIQRTNRIWFIWEQLYDDIVTLIKTYDPPVAVQALEVLADLAIYDQEERAE